MPRDNATKPINHPAVSMSIMYLTKLDLRVSELQGLPIYDVRMMGGLRKLTSACGEAVHNHRRSLLRTYDMEENYPGDIYRDVEYPTSCTEEAMVECGAHQSDDRYYSADIEGVYTVHMFCKSYSMLKALCY